MQRDPGARRLPHPAGQAVVVGVDVSDEHALHVADARADVRQAAVERVRGMWLSGSLARGAADAVSDLDVLIAVSDDDPASFDAFAAGWRDWLAAITPTVIARPLAFAPGSLYSVTPGRERLDVVVGRTSALPSTFFRTRVVAFDRDGLDALIPPAPPGSGPPTERIAPLAEA